MNRKKFTKQTRVQRTQKSILPDETVEESSGNVFADLGLPNAGELLLKAELALKIRELVEQRGWTAAETAQRISIHQPTLSNLLSGKFPDVPVDSLLTIVNRLTM